MSCLRIRRVIEAPWVMKATMSHRGKYMSSYVEKWVTEATESSRKKIIEATWKNHRCNIPSHTPTLGFPSLSWWWWLVDVDDKDEWEMEMRRQMRRLLIMIGICICSMGGLHIHSEKALIDRSTHYILGCPWQTVHLYSVNTGKILGSREADSWLCYIKQSCSMDQ